MTKYQEVTIDLNLTSRMNLMMYTYLLEKFISDLLDRF
jgi:hypothetical protein